MKSSAVFKTAIPLVAALGLLAVLYGISLYNYLLFHTLIELFSLLTAFGIFALAWHTRATHDNRYLLFIGIAFLFSGVLELLHLISFKGMGILPRNDENLATQFWVAFRIVLSLSFLISVRFIRAKLNIGRTIGMYLAVVSALTVSILLGWFPDCYTGTGLTRFKIASEYAICLIFLSAFILLIRKRRDFDPDVLRFTMLSILFSIATEISFTKYASVYGFSNMLGHLFLLASVASMYRAIVVTAVVAPSTLLFRDLKQREEAATASEKKYRLLFENMIDALAYHRIVCDEQGKPVDYIFLEVNAAFEALTGLKATDVIGKSVRAVLPGIEKDPADWIGVYGKVALTGQPVWMEQHALALGKWFAVSAYSPASKHFVAVFEDITERKRVEAALRESEERFRTTLDNLLEGCQIIGHDWRYVYINEVAARHGRSGREILIGRTMMECFPGIENTAMFFRLKECMEHRRHSRLENLFSYPDGSQAWFDLSFEPVKEGVFILSQDITERKRAEEALRENEERLRLFIEHAPAALAMFDRSMRYVSVSRRWMHDYGLGDRDLRGLSHYEIFPEISEDWKNVHRRALAGDVVRNDNDRFERADGSVQWLQWEVRPWHSAAGEIAGIVIFSEDITDRKRAEEALRESEQQFRTLADSIPNLAWWANGNGYLTWYNQRWYEYTGTMPEQMEGWGWQSVHDPEVLPKVLERWKASIATGEPFDMEFPLRGADGIFRPFLTRVMPLKDASGKVLRWFGTNTDVTERKKAEEALKESENRYHSLFDNMTEGFAYCKMLYDDSGQPLDFVYLEVNHSFERLTGLKGVVGKKVTEVIPGIRETDPELFRIYGRVATECGTDRLEFYVEALKEWFSLSVYCPQKEYFVAIFDVITERRKIQDELRRMNVELEQRVTERTAELRNLQAHVEAVREAERTGIAREIHDELGQVLTAIKMDVSWLSKRLPSGQNSLVDKAEDTLRIIDAAIQSVKRISAELRPGVLDIGLPAAIDWACKEFGNRTGVSCTVAILPENLTIDRMRSTALFRILQEALTNITRHARCTSVSVSLVQRDRAFILTVKDNGKGIRPEEVSSPHAFGLIGMRERVQFLHGRITVDGSPESGTTVTVTLPIDSEGEQVMPGPAAREAARQEPGGAIAGEGVKEP